MAAAYPRRGCRGKARSRPRRTVGSERGNHLGVALSGGRPGHRWAGALSAVGVEMGQSPRSSRRPGEPGTGRRRAADLECAGLVDEALGVANKEQLTYQGFLAELLLAEDHWTCRGRAPPCLCADLGAAATPARPTGRPSPSPGVIASGATRGHDISRSGDASGTVRRCRRHPLQDRAHTRELVGMLAQRPAPTVVLGEWSGQGQSAAMNTPSASPLAM